MSVAVGELYGMVWEGVGSARGRPQAGRTSESRREIARVVCHEAALERGTHGGKKTKRKARGTMERERERGRWEREGNESWNKEERCGAPTYPRMAKDTVGERERERTRIDRKYRAQELDPQPVRNKRSFI